MMAFFPLLTSPPVFLPLLQEGEGLDKGEEEESEVTREAQSGMGGGGMEQ